MNEYSKWVTDKTEIRKGDEIARYSYAGEVFAILKAPCDGRWLPEGALGKLDYLVPENRGRWETSLKRYSSFVKQHRSAVGNIERCQTLLENEKKRLPNLIEYQRKIVNNGRGELITCIVAGLISALSFMYQTVGGQEKYLAVAGIILPWILIYYLVTEGNIESYFEYRRNNKTIDRSEHVRKAEQELAKAEKQLKALIS